MTITDQQINDHAEELLADIRRHHGDRDALDEPQRRNCLILC